MALDRLAPDQRAVVQLVLQQERSYDELAELLGISTDAVRDRARRGLERLDPGTGLSDDERGQIADYLLGQQSVSRREATRRMLGEDAQARAWAQSLADDLESVARSPLPEVPTGADTDAEDTAATQAAATVAAGEPVVGSGAAATPGIDRPVRARPRPSATSTEPRPDRPAGEDAQRPRSSLLGGALLLGGLALVVAAIVIWLVFGSDDDTERAGGNGATPTATPDATPQPAAQIPLESPDGGEASGQMTLFVSEGGQIAFTIEGTNVPAPGDGEAYAMWLAGGDEPHRLGFITDENPDDGNIGVSGPQETDVEEFPQWFAEAKRVLVTRETTQDAKKPGPVVLRGRIQGGGQGG